MSKQFLRILKLVAGPLILLLLFYKVGFVEIIALLETITFVPILLAYLLFVVSVILGGINLRVLLSPLRDVPPRRFWHYYFASRITSLVLPGRLGELSISYFLNKEKMTYGEGIAAVLMDKLITFSLAVVVGLVALHSIFGPMTVGGGVLLGGVLYIAGLVLVGMVVMSRKVRSLVRRYILRKYAVYFSGFSATLFSYAKKNKKCVLINIFLTLLRMLVIAGSAQLMFRAVGAEVPLITLFLIGGIEQMSTMIPLTINGLGIKQSIGVLLFGLLGLAPGVVAARYVVGLLIQYSFGFISAVFVKPYGGNDETAC